MFLSQVKNIFSSLFLTAIASVFFLPTASAAEPIRVILDLDGAFEDFYALLVLSLASGQDSPPINLI